MEGRGSYERVVRVHNLADYFRTSIDDAIGRQGVQVDPHAAHYVVNLLTLFSRSEEFYEDDGEHYGLRPFALLLADAADARSPEQRKHSLQRIGDVALFVAGFFAESFDDKPVDIDYYVCMGGSAYGSLSEEVRGTFRGNAFADIYRELAVKFQVLVDILNEVRDEARQDSVVDLMRSYRIWRKTGSQRALRTLRQHGVVPIGGARRPHRH